MDYGQNPRASTAYNSSGQYGGYYTPGDIREVVAYAQQRHITVVPEIEIPCHCPAALLAYPALRLREHRQRITTWTTSNYEL